MARQLGWALAALILIGTTPLPAQEEQQTAAQPPKTEARRDGSSQQSRGPWIWWKDQKAVAELRITPEQATEIDGIFRTTMHKAKPLREEVQQLEKALNATMKANVADVSVVAQQVDTVETKRAELNKMRVVMLYRMHKVLSPEQNTKFQAMVDRWEASRRKQDGDRRR